MRSLRERMSDRLIAWGTEMALAKQHMLQSAHRKGVRTREAQAFAQMVTTADLLSRIAIRLGFKLMPARLPEGR